MSGSVYHGEPEHTALLIGAYAAFSVCNPLHADIWPSAMKFEAEVTFCFFLWGGSGAVND